MAAANHGKNQNQLDGGYTLYETIVSLFFDAFGSRIIEALSVILTDCGRQDKAQHCARAHGYRKIDTIINRYIVIS